MPFPFQLTTQDSSFVFRWSLSDDHAELRRRTGGELVWSGSLLPLLWFSDARGDAQAIKVQVDEQRSVLGPQDAALALQVGEFGVGSLRVTLRESAVQFEELQFIWNAPTGPALRALYFGSSVLNEAERASAPNLEQPFWPDWRAEGFCIPSAKTNPIQSLFRSWDF